jgi:hypothetical protein
MATPMKKHWYFDIHDPEVTPAVYHLLWAVIYETPNDLIHEVWWERFVDAIEFGDNQRKQYNERISHPDSYCYSGGKEQLEAFKAKTPPTFEEAIEEYRLWLEARGVDALHEPVLVKMWW